MKIFISLLILVLVLTKPGFSQIENIPVTKNVFVSRVYAGALSTAGFSIDSLSAFGNVNLWTGAEAKWKPKKWFSFSGLGVLNSQESEINTLVSLCASFHLNSKMKISLGNRSTPATFYHRPHPVSPDSQFETFTTAQIPGSAPGAVFTIGNANSKKDNFAFAFGVYSRNLKPEYHLSMKINFLKISTWYANFKENFGMALKLEFGSDSTALKISTSLVVESFVSSLVPFNGTFVEQHQSGYASLICLDFGRNHSYTFYSDIGYYEENLVRAEIGLLRHFSSEFLPLSGLFGIGYGYEQRIIPVYIFIHL